jgi:GT2 family glycosyltransferase
VDDLRGLPGQAPSVSVVVSTFDWPEALDVVLRGLSDQTDQSHEVVVADDGSGPATEAVVQSWSRFFGGRLRHAWQPDEGFRLARVRNLGAEAATGDYLVFIDGDCIPRHRFVSAVRQAARPGWYLAGKRVQLSELLSARVLRGETRVTRSSVAALALRQRGAVAPLFNLTARDRRRPWRPSLPDFAPHDNAYGFLTCVARSDFERVNGFDMRFLGWGDQDVDLAVRLRRGGLRCGFGGPRTTMLHLWHPSHATRDRASWYQLRETLRTDRIEAVQGIRELAAETSPARTWTM